MRPNPAPWGRYHELRPDQLSEILAAAPVAYWPLGLIEHHGWHLPVGLDGLKAERICLRCAARTGGVVLPTMWWGARGGHGDFHWTLYEPEEAAEAIAAHTVGKLIDFGFRAIVLLAGHYPWVDVLGRRLPALQRAHPECLLMWGTEMDLVPDLSLPGDHAAREETSYGLALFPELIAIDALRPGRSEEEAWPAGGAPPPDARHPGVCFEAGSARFAQMGEDARTGSAARGKAALSQLVDGLVAQIAAYLEAGT
jgi:creatinine amidohydrolase